MGFFLVSTFASLARTGLLLLVALCWDGMGAKEAPAGTGTPSLSVSGRTRLQPIGYAPGVKSRNSRQVIIDRDRGLAKGTGSPPGPSQYPLPSFSILNLDPNFEGFLRHEKSAWLSLIEVSVTRCASDGTFRLRPDRPICSRGTYVPTYIRGPWLI